MELKMGFQNALFRKADQWTESTVSFGHRCRKAIHAMKKMAHMFCSWKSRWPLAI